MKVSSIVAGLLVLGFSFAFADEIMEFSADNRVAQGEKLFKSASFAGSPNDKSCNTCHAQGKGFKENLFGRDEYMLMGMKQKTLKDVVNACIMTPLQGKAIDHNSKEMTNLLAYMKTISK